MSTHLRVASVNVNGVRAAVRNGMLGWLDAADVDVLTLQEVRADADQLALSLPGWHFAFDEASAKGRAGVAIGTRTPLEGYCTEIADQDLDTKGRWIELDVPFGDDTLTVVSAYVFTGEAGTDRQVAKHAFLDAVERRLASLTDTFAVVTGDLNVGHQHLDIRNWRGNVKKAGFLPQERAHFDRILARGAPIEAADGTQGTGLGWIDVGRRFHGEVDGPYTWWSNRGKAFDNDTGWRIDYHLASAGLAATAVRAGTDRDPAPDRRISDHAPVVVDYDL